MLAPTTLLPVFCLALWSLVPPPPPTIVYGILPPDPGASPHNNPVAVVQRAAAERTAFSGMLQRDNLSRAPSAPASPGRAPAVVESEPKLTREQKRAQQRVDDVKRDIVRAELRATAIEKAIQERTGGQVDANGQRVVTGEGRRGNIQEMHRLAVENERKKAQSLGKATAPKDVRDFEKRVAKLERQRDAALTQVTKDVQKANAALDKLRAERTKLDTKKAGLEKKLEQRRAERRVVNQKQRGKK